MRTGVDERSGSARLAELQVVVVTELGGGEAVVELDEIEVVGADTGRLVGLAAALRLLRVFTSCCTWPPST